MSIWACRTYPKEALLKEIEATYPDQNTKPEEGTTRKWLPNPFHEPPSEGESRIRMIIPHVVQLISLLRESIISPALISLVILRF